MPGLAKMSRILHMDSASSTIAAKSTELIRILIKVQSSCNRKEVR